MPRPDAFERRADGVVGAATVGRTETNAAFIGLDSELDDMTEDLLNGSCEIIFSPTRETYNS